MRELFYRLVGRPALAVFSGAFGPRIEAVLPVVVVILLALAFLARRRIGFRLAVWSVAAPVLAASMVTAIMAALPALAISYGNWRPLALPLALAAVLAGLVFVVFLCLLPGPRSRAALAGLLSLALAAELGTYVYSAVVEPSMLEVSALEVRMPPFPAGSLPLHIVHLSDLHVERVTRRDRQMLEQVAELDPDVILISGDLSSVDYRDAPGQDALRQVLSGLHARYGVYAIRGNVDTPEEMAAVTEGTSVRVLENEVLRLDWSGPPVYILGMSTTGYLPKDRATFEGLLASTPPGCTRILLYHYPDLFETARSAGIGLYLAGHTHGGQIRLPFFGAPVRWAISDKWYERGWFPWDGGGMYVNRGVGFEGLGIPRVRFRSRPEIASITLSSP